MLSLMQSNNSFGKATYVVHFTMTRALSARVPRADVVDSGQWTDCMLLTEVVRRKSPLITDKQEATPIVYAHSP